VSEVDGIGENWSHFLLGRIKINGAIHRTLLFTHALITGFYWIGGAWNRPTLAIVGHRRESKILIRTFPAVTSGNRQILL